LITKEFQPASRVAHSLKGSLGSLHAPRARHWAQTLELAAASGDGERYRQSFSALEQSLSDLEPKLQDLLKA
jgi:HPt (histidine-containing phosphotransfer) domain-containing protein